MTDYPRFRYAALQLWREHNGQALTDAAYRTYCVNAFTDYVIAADIAWPGDDTRTWPHSIPGSDHLRDHLAHDWALDEGHEVRFRDWWSDVMDHGFTMPAPPTPT